MKKVILSIIIVLSSFNLFGQVNTDSLVKHILIGINERRDIANLPKGKLDERLNKICSELIDMDIKSGGRLTDNQSYNHINPKTNKLFTFGDVRYSYAKLNLITNYYKGIEKTISNDFFITYNQYNNGEFFIINSKNYDMSDGVCHLGISARLIDKEIYLYFIILSETKDDFVYQP